MVVLLQNADCRGFESIPSTEGNDLNTVQFRLRTIECRSLADFIQLFIVGFDTRKRTLGAAYLGTGTLESREFSKPGEILNKLL